MNRLSPASDSSDERVGQQPSGDALHSLGEALAQLGGDTDYIIRSLTELIFAMRPVSKQGLTMLQERFLIETGAFSADGLASTASQVGRGAVQLGAAEAWLSNLCATLSLEAATGFLGWDEEAVRTAVSEGRLYAIEISGRLRFPAWQFSVRHPNKLIPGLTEVIEVVTPQWDWHSVAGFMATPQAGLVAEGRKTPVDWLGDGGEVNDVIEIIEVSEWS